MHLINTHTLRLEEHFFDNVKGKYAILSHTWGEGEVTFQDVNLFQPAVQEKPGWQKVLHTCTEARNSGLKYAWVDTCCIDKSSSSELSEAINSMFKWYSEANVCYVYMSDVSCPSGDAHFGPTVAYEVEAPAARLSGQTISEFRTSRWWKRGWTLQELIAPARLRFYSRGWVLLGQTMSVHELPDRYDRGNLDAPTPLDDLLDLISSITAVPASVLFGTESAHSYSIAQRMSWASSRSTTREEDQAYCLFGLFDINMPLLYGEGRRAFGRLQEEIIKADHDQSIFAWEDPFPSTSFVSGRPQHISLESWPTVPSELFANSTHSFADCGDVVTWAVEAGSSSYHLTNRGLDVSFFHPKKLVTASDGVQVEIVDKTVAILQCRREDDFSHALALNLSAPSNSGEQSVVANRDSYHAIRRTPAILQSEHMAGPIRTIILSRPPRNSFSGGTHRKRQRRLLIETTVPGPIGFSRLEPTSLWNRSTLVMTPDNFHASINSRWNQFHQPLTACKAMVGFEHDAENYVIVLEYGRRRIAKLSMTRAAYGPQDASADIMDLAGPLESIDQATVDDGADIFCSLRASNRLGEDVMVLRIGLLSQLHSAAAPDTQGESDILEFE